MTKNIIKAIILSAITAMTLTGCMNNERAHGPIIHAQAAGKDTTSTSTITEVEKPVTSTTSKVEKPETSTETKPEETSSTVSNVEKPATSTTSETSSSTTSSKPSTPEVEKPVSSTTTQETSKPSSQPVEEPVHNHSFSKATCTTPATCISCGATQGTPTNHNFYNGVCTTCGTTDPSYVAPHNCNKDGHIWGDSYTKVETENTEIIEVHTIAGNGYDSTLALRYFGRTATTNDFEAVFGPGHTWGASSTKVKTNATKTTTKYFHTCKECGKSEMYDSTEVVDPGTKWEFVTPRSNFNTIWYDINNVPQSVRDDVAKDDSNVDDFLQGLLSSGNWDW